MYRQHGRTVYVIQIARCTVCRLGSGESGANRMATGSFIDFRAALRQIAVKYFYESGFYQY